MESPPTQNWKEDIQAMGDREPPDCWDMEFTDSPSCPKTVHKLWRGAATFIPKVSPVTTKKRSADCKEVMVHTKEFVDSAMNEGYGFYRSDD